MLSGISHQAAIASVTRSIIEPVASVEANITGTTNLFDIAAESSCRRIVFASSCAVYGNGPESPKQEGQPLDPRSPYAVTKATKEMLARTFCDLHSIEIVGLRYFNVYGRRQNPASDYAAVIPAFITRALRNEPLLRGGRRTADARFRVHRRRGAGQPPGTRGAESCRAVFNVGTGTNISILELARLVVTTAGSTSAVVHGPSRAGDVRDSRADIGRASHGAGVCARVFAHAGGWPRPSRGTAGGKEKPPEPVTGPGEPLQAA